MKLTDVLEQEPRMVRRIRAACEKVPIGEVVSSKSLSRRLGVTSIAEHATHPSLAKHRFTVARTTWWGSSETVKKARQLQK